MKMTKEQAMAWAIALKRDKTVGDGVTNTNGVDGFEDGTEEYQNIDDIYDDFSFYLIARLIGEPVWEIDFKLFTIDSLMTLKGITDKSNRHKCYVEYLKEFGKPYTAERLDEILEDYPVGEANLFE
jgi:hypothetical protein